MRTLHAPRVADLGYDGWSRLCVAARVRAAARERPYRVRGLMRWKPTWRSLPSSGRTIVNVERLVAGTTTSFSCTRRLRCPRSEEHTSELQSRQYLVCRLLLEKKKKETFTTMAMCYVVEVTHSWRSRTAYTLLKTM